MTKASAGLLSTDDGTPIERAAGSLVANLSAGALMAFLTANFALSYAALLFAGTPAESQAHGLVMMLGGAIVMTLVASRLCSMPFSMLSPDGTSVALLASITGDMVVEMQGAATPEITATLAMALMLGGVATGCGLWLIGLARVGGIVRFIPFQVMAGVLAASGWSLAAGGAAVATGQAVDLTLPTDPAALLKLAPALVLAGAMLFVARAVRHAVALPLLLILAILLHHAVFALLGWTPPEQRAAGWLIALPPRLELALPWSRSVLGAVDWSVLADHATGLLVLVPVTTLSLLLGLGGVESAIGRDADADGDLRAMGITAVATGALGGVYGSISLSRTAMAHAMGVRGRGAGLIAGIAGGAGPLLWPALLGLVPRFVLGGLLLFSGFSLLLQWGLNSRRRLTWSEWATVLIVLLVAARYGLIPGAATGLLLGCITFAVICSRSSPIRARYRGDAARSHVDRAVAELDFLDAAAETVLVLHLQGFVFFGTASRLIDDVRREIAATPGRLRHLILEFSHVQGIDGSALASFERLRRVADQAGIALAFVAMPPRVAARLAGLPGTAVHVARTLDAALEWREATVLAAMPPIAMPSLSALLAAEFAHAEDAAVFFSLLEEVWFAPGEAMMHQGELSDDLLFIADGRASVTVRFAPGQAPMRVRIFGVGTMIGEIGFCLGLPRTATVTAEVPCRVLRLTRAAEIRMEAEHPAVALAFQRAVLRRLGDRLLNKDQLIAALVADRVEEEEGEGFALDPPKAGGLWKP